MKKMLFVITICLLGQSAMALDQKCYDACLAASSNSYYPGESADCHGMPTPAKCSSKLIFQLRQDCLDRCNAQPTTPPPQQSSLPKSNNNIPYPNVITYPPTVGGVRD